MSSITAAKLDGVGVADHERGESTYENKEATPTHISPLSLYGWIMRDKM
jgi:hypothetical protein